ncbi:glycosyltransferase family 4 protein [Uliginosibacterium flavum]|uniref:Glycosyltransferase family 4 protein n=1 Tax=Uliginosibacterium flavum TaxID=1396831 RepID=A0ABV2TGV4_9RHOO
MLGVRKKKLLFFVAEDWYFCSHRLPLGVAAREADYEVTVVTRVREHGEQILEAGLRLIPIELERRSANPLAEIRFLFQLWKIYRQEQPDLVHHVSLKPVLYGSLVAMLAGVPRVVNAMAGMGILFSSTSLKARVLRVPVLVAFRVLLGGGRKRMILQNPDNVAEMVGARIVSLERVRLIKGAGVNLAEYALRPEPDGVPRIVLVARMLWDKGVGDFVAAARLLRQQGVSAEFLLVGEPDDANPATISTAQLQSWQDDGVVQWLGRRSDVPAILASCHIACLPSYYGEGVPKSLLEAAACGRAIVTTDAPGCREVVRDGENGLLVPVKDVVALAGAIKVLVEDPALRVRMGAAGRRLAEAEFSVESVAQQTLQVYAELLEA